MTAPASKDWPAVSPPPLSSGGPCAISELCRCPESVEKNYQLKQGSLLNNIDEYATTLKEQ